MASTKHTPGPWWYSRHSNEVGTVPMMDIKVCGWVSGANPEEQVANGLVIAATPVMLATLEEIARLSSPNIQHPNQEWIHTNAVYAIAQALKGA